MFLQPRTFFFSLTRYVSPFPSHLLSVDWKGFCYQRCLLPSVLKNSFAPTKETSWSPLQTTAMPLSCTGLFMTSVVTMSACLTCHWDCNLAQQQCVKINHLLPLCSPRVPNAPNLLKWWCFSISVWHSLSWWEANMIFDFCW